MTAHRNPLAIELTIIVVAVLAFGTFLALQRPQVAPTPTPSVSIAPAPPTRDELLKLVNEQRQKAGVAPLIEDSRLDQSAQRKADDMAKYNYYAHVSPHDGKHGYEYINDVGISCKTDSENIAGAPTAKEAVDSWVRSKLHYAAMIGQQYALTGFGITYVKDIPLNNISVATPATTDLANSYVIVEHFCQQ